MIKATPARVKFKHHLGHANHFLVTALVALHTLEASNIVEAPAELRTSWNPKDKSASIARTRIFVTQSFLGWAVDSIDLYLSLLNRKPRFLQDSSLIVSLDGANRSVLRKARAIAAYANLVPATRALVDVLITWRNNVFHELSDNRVSPETRKALTEHASFIEGKYRNLCANGLSDKAEAGDGLTFKEATSLINAAQHFVEEVDSVVLARLDQRAFCTDAILEALNDREQATGFAAKCLGLTLEKRRRFIKNWFKNTLGFQLVAPEVLDACAALQRAKAVR